MCVATEMRSTRSKLDEIDISRVATSSTTMILEPRCKGIGIIFMHMKYPDLCYDFLLYIVRISHVCGHRNEVHTVET